MPSRHPTQPTWTPADHGHSRQRSTRGLVIAIAVAIVVVHVVSGFVYLGMWDRAGHELVRLLPADTSLHAAAPQPFRQLRRALDLERWADRDALAADIEQRGFFASEPGGDVAGIPLALIREVRLLRAVDSVHLVIVPGGDGPTTLLLVEIADLLARRRVVAELSPLVETVARHVGFDIEAVTQSPWVRFTGVDAAAPRVVVMDPYIVLAWGAPEGLDELLDARVGGRLDNLRGAELLDALERPLDPAPADFRVTVDPALLWSLLTPAGPRTGAVPQGLGHLHARSRFISPAEGEDDGGDDEVVTVAARVVGDAAVARLEAAFSPADHPLIGYAPTDAAFAVSLSTQSPLNAVTALREILARAGADGGQLAAIVTGLASLELVDPEVAFALAGDVMWTALPPETPVAPLTADALANGWVLLARPARPDLAEQVLSQLLASLLEDRYAFGRVRTPDGYLHLVQPALPPSPGAPVEEILAWRVRGDRLELAPRVAHLERLDRLDANARTYAHSALAAHAHRFLPPISEISVVIHPGWLEALGSPLIAPAAARLASTFRVAATLGVTDGRLEMSTNLGPWTLIAAAAAADRATIDRLTLPGLAPRCRAAHDAMCARYPEAVPCRPLSLGRADRIRAACDAILAQPAP